MSVEMWAVTATSRADGMNESQMYSPIKRFFGPCDRSRLHNAQFRFGHCQLQNVARGCDQEGKGDKAN
jgi:hypothetical protein